MNINKFIIKNKNLNVIMHQNLKKIIPLVIYTDMRWTIAQSVWINVLIFFLVLDLGVKGRPDSVVSQCFTDFELLFISGMKTG